MTTRKRKAARRRSSDDALDDRDYKDGNGVKILDPEALERERQEKIAKLLSTVRDVGFERERARKAKKEKSDGNVHDDTR